MRKLDLFLVIVAISLTEVDAQESPGLAPEINTFALNQDVVGVASRSVNLFTGDVSLPINLISLAGRNGMDASVTISYRSNVHDAIDTWNQVAPSGILGLGWSLNISKIVADHKQTGTREDDEYYLVEGGTSNKLARTLSGSDGGGSYNTYETKNYQFWKIKFYYGSSTDRWEIIREDGTKYVYGDKNSGRSTIQYVVKWDNWVGNSAQTSNQSQLSFAWNLSEVMNQWGDKLTFEYMNVENFVGTSSGQKQTEASYVKEITDPVGKKIQFIYNDKQSQFYAEPHTEQTEPDAYQEFYEKKYLDYIDVLDETANKFLSINFGYDEINTGTSAAKMLLTSIEQVNSASNALPPLRFEYFGQGPAKGFLKTVKYPTAGVIAYDYKENLIGHSDRKLELDAPAGFSEPKIWINGDYAVVAWRKLMSGTNTTQPQDVLLYAYQWVGEWKGQFLQTITGIGSDEDFSIYLNFQILTESNFFAVLKGGTNDNYTLYIWHKDSENRGHWKSYSQSANYGEGTPTLLSGDNFVVVGSFKDDSTHPSYRYVFDGDGWSQTTLNQTGGDHYYTSANNYFISHNRAADPGGAGGPQINYYYLTEDKKWVAKNISTTFNSNERSYWHASNSFAIVMADDNPEYIYSWNSGYTSFLRNSSSLGTWDDDSYVFNIDNSMAAISELGTSDGRIVRYDGSNWIASEDINADSHYRSIAFGQDMAIWAIDYNASPVTGRWAIFNPNSLSWSYTNQNYSPNTSLYTSSFGYNPLQLGSGFLAYHDKGYFRPAGGTWSPDYTIAAPTGTTIQALSFAIPSDKFFLYRSTGINGGSIVQFIHNGIVGSLENLEGYFGTNVATANPGVSRKIVWANRAIVGTMDLPMSSSEYVVLYAVVNQKASGKQTDNAVSLITTISEGQARYTAINYNVAKAAFDPSGNVAMYNEVTVIPGSMAPAETSNGYTKTYFHNGLTSEELFESFFSTDLRWNGLPYKTEAYDANGTLVSYSQTTYTTYTQDLLNDQSTRVDVAHYIRPTKVVQMVDGIVSTTTNSYDSNTGLLTQSSVSGPVSMQIQHKYFWEEYDPTRNRNILTPVIQTKRKIDGQFVEAKAVRYKNWNALNNPAGVFAAYDEYVWRGTGSPDFSVWNVGSNPSSDWVVQTKVSVRENVSGAPIEAVTPGERISCTILGQNKHKVFAQISNAPLTDVGFTSFEDGSKGNFSWTDGTTNSGTAKTGTKFFAIGTTGITRNGLNAAETYRISFWAKSANGSVIIDGIGTVNLGNLTDWTLFEFDITGETSITLKRTGSTTVTIDELRLFPQNAMMSTFTYHPVYGQLSAMDQNNQVIYTEYDEWGRAKNTLDESGNILSAYFYNYKD